VLDFGILVIVRMRIVHIISDILKIVLHDQPHVSYAETGIKTNVLSEIKIYQMLGMEKEGETQVGIHICPIEIHISPGEDNFASGGMIDVILLCLKSNKGQDHRQYEKGLFHF
jgi:hypothetical protein